MLYRLWVSMIVWLTYFLWKIFMFYSLLEGFTSFQDYHKTSCVFLHFGRVFKHVKLFSNLIFWKPLLSKGGWLRDHALWAYLKIFLTCAWKGGIYELYTFSSLCFQLVSQLASVLYTHICFDICMLQLQIVSISIGI